MFAYFPIGLLYVELLNFFSKILYFFSTPHLLAASIQRRNCSKKDIKLLTVINQGKIKLILSFNQADVAVTSLL